MSRLPARALLAFSVTFATAFGQTPPAAPAQAASNASNNGAPFSLEDAIGLALKKNFDLQVQSFVVENAKDAIAIQEAAFDPTVTASGRRSVNQAASNTSRLDGAQTEGPRTDSTTLSVGATLPRIAATNGTLGVSTNVSRSATNSTNALLNPSFGHGVSANLNQPLLNGAGRFNATSALQRAKLGLNIASINYKSRVLSVISDTENAYYNLVAARETLRIRQLTFQYNQKLLEENQARRTTGVATDLDVLSAEVGVATSRRGIIQAEQSVRDAEDRLLNLINVPNFDVRVGPVAFDDYKGGTPTFAASYKLAREYYPDTLSVEQAIKQLEIDLETARRNQLPDLDLLASLGYTARATNAGYNQAISNLPNDHGNNWSVALNYSMPWGRHAEKARYRTAQTNISSRKVQLEQLEQTLLVNVRAAVRAVESNVAAVEIATKATELAARQYEQQKARFDAGLSTSRLVLLAQDDLENARFSELNSRLALRRAAAELNRLEGSSLQRFRVQLPQ
ncbi:TolC family protein [Horticoccus sp. 23ND18S-11]|uniref:TolC family protein n=1 Tax=Horticoccus sp. 23ND18S-11 TaxID=3391832 RepID=UPI0039C991AF